MSADGVGAGQVENVSLEHAQVGQLAAAVLVVVGEREGVSDGKRGALSSERSCSQAVSSV
ncbi:hypothetical protein GCM10009654_57520 [Streptomyces hebeiensis]|uniref:Uncharacterized protein n=1 Tax=Streptomyces hebeiensis TaxID=229486 RepID=A0ABP4FP62_9ACTN